MRNENILKPTGIKRMGQRDLKQRTKLFALEVITFVEELPKRRTVEILGRQLLRSGTSAGANYRSACRARSAADFIAKMGIVEEEIDESIYWMELLVESGIISLKDIEALMKEAPVGSGSCSFRIPNSAIRINKRRDR
ncbi:MAG: four helix bundle protein [Deltaproteobacteria bacterium]|nr:four helix bundle protein [Deltaproteobacteria bacterium]